MLLPNPFCPISAAKIAGLKATVMLLLVLLMKSKLLRIKMSLLGSMLGFAMLVGFLLTSGLLTTKLAAMPTSTKTHLGRRVVVRPPAGKPWPAMVTVGVTPMREGRDPVLDSTRGTYVKYTP